MTLREKEALVSDLNVAAIRQRAEQATPGPWRCKGDCVVAEPTDDHVICFGHDYDDYGVMAELDAEFIAHARSDIPALLAQLALLEAQQTALRDALLKVTEHMDRAGGDAYAMPECPWCHWQDDRMEHASDCELFQARELLEALALPRAPSPKEQT